MRYYPYRRFRGRRYCRRHCFRRYYWWRYPNYYGFFPSGIMTGMIASQLIGAFVIGRTLQMPLNRMCNIVKNQNKLINSMKNR